MRPSRYLFGLLCTIQLAFVSCGPAPNVRANNPAERFNFSQTPTKMRQQLAGRTAKFDEPQHGTQIEYFAPDGKAYLWYPGNLVAVPSDWKVEAKAGKTVICFRYPNRSYNPVTQQFGGRWECRSSSQFGRSMTALIEGDEFNLRSGKIPKQIPRRAQLSTSQVERMVGRPIAGEFIFGR